VPVTGPAVAKDMLTALYGADSLENIWTCGFVKGAENWAGRRGFSWLSSVDCDAGDFYFCIGELGAAETRRSSSGVETQRVLICDDIGTKASLADWDTVLGRGFPPPNFRVETSPGNQTWIWKLDKPVTRDDLSGWRDLALLRAWLVARGLTDDVMDAARYVRLPMGVNSKDKYLVEGVSPRVGLFLGDADAVANVDRMGSILLETDDWRDEDLPSGAGSSSAALGVASAAGALARVADLSDPEPIIVLAQALGQEPVQVRAGVVEARCPNIAEHSDRPETGFAFLGGGLMKCSHASCADLSTMDFRAMMVAEYEAQAAAAQALGLPWDGAVSGEGFLARADFERRGAVAGKDVSGADTGATEDPEDPEEIAERLLGKRAAREEARDDGLDELCSRFVWLDSQNAFFDLADRVLVSPEVFDRHSAVAGWIPAGGTGAKRASNLLRNRGGMVTAHALAYVPGAVGQTLGRGGTAGVGSLIMEENEASRMCPHVNLWMPPDTGRRSGPPSAWLELLDHLVPEPEYRGWLVCFFAMLVQKPGWRTPNIPLLVGGQGVGKDLMLSAVIRILGRSNARTVSMAQLGSGFNDYLMSQLIILPELRTDRAGSINNQVKDWTGQGAARLQINPKYARTFSVRPVMNFIALSNHLDAVGGLETDDRRWAVYVTDAARRDQDWYTRIAGELSGAAELERLHEFLWNVDLTSFDPFASAPDVGGFKGQMLSESLGEAATWVLEACSDGGVFADREYLTIKEVQKAAQGARSVAVSRGITQSAVRDGMVAAGCECWGQARAGKSSRRLWFGNGLSALDRAVLIKSKMPEKARIDLYEAEEKAFRAAADSKILGGK